MIAVRLVVVTLVALILQLTLFIDIRVFGVVPELLALMAVLAGYYLKPERGLLVAFGIGLLWDIYLSTPIGLNAITFALVAFSVATLQEGLFHDTKLQVIGLVAVGSAACVLGYALLGAMVGQSGLVDVNLLRVSAIVAALNALLTPIVALAMRWALRRPEPLGLG